MVNSTAKHLRACIRATGPISVATFMAEAIAAYYAHTDPFGVDGDFITAPEISQIFGELIGLWAAVVWQDMGAPERVRLIELGPGRGTLMVDLLRAAQVVPAFITALEVHMIETSPRLITLQRQRLEGIGVPVVWHNHVTAVPPGPLLVVANEFLDALPICQFKRTVHGWQERLVGLAADGKTFRFVLGPVNFLPPLPESVRDSAPVGALAEGALAVQAAVAAVATRLTCHGGAALFIDYGPVTSAVGDSLQAMRSHTPHLILEEPGTVDLTAHVDFAAAATTAFQAGARVHGPICQGEWLRRLGILTRTNVLLARSSPEQANLLVTGVHRLIDGAAMGSLFKVLGLAHPGLPFLPGLDPSQEAGDTWFGRSVG